MANFIKHVGVEGKGKKVVIVFRQIPGDESSCLVVYSDDLPTAYHDDLIKAVESTNAQDTIDLSDYLFRQNFTDGTNMLSTLHQRGWLIKAPTKSIVAVPSPGVSINLLDLNRELSQIAKKNVASGNQKTAPLSESTGNQSVLDDKVMAQKFRGQANTFEAEVIRLRTEADKLDPPTNPNVVLSSVPNEMPAPQEKRGRGRPPKSESPQMSTVVSVVSPIVS